MNTGRLLAALLVLSTSSLPAPAASDDDDWALAGHVLALMQSVLRVAVTSPDPRAAERAIDTMLSGENAEANRLGGRIVAEIASDMPVEVRSSLGAIARDLVLLARRDQGRAAPRAEREETERHLFEALRARKDLAAMGLAYHDPMQFLEAVRRDDALAVELFVLGRGVNLAARDRSGRTALEIAQRAGNRALASLLEGAAAR